jgi:hypothetical protein
MLETFLKLSNTALSTELLIFMRPKGAFVNITKLIIKNN